MIVLPAVVFATDTYTGGTWSTVELFVNDLAVNETASLPIRS